MFQEMNPALKSSIQPVKIFFQHSSCTGTEGEQVWHRERMAELVFSSQLFILSGVL